MESKIGWCQDEVMCKAYKTWNRILVNADIIQNVVRNGELELNNSNIHLDLKNATSNMELSKRKNHQSSISLFQQQQQQELKKNKASICNLYLNQSEDSIFLDSFTKPWIPQNFKYDSGYNGLHKEIILFNDYISPTFEEKFMRDEIVSKIKKVIGKELPHAIVEVFGSYKTGLYLPTSDIDIVVFGEWKHLPLNCLKQAIIRDNISDSENIKVLDRATVPIIKVTENKTEFKIDISFNTLNGVKSALMIQEFISKFPALRPLVMVLKQFLLQWDYNDVWRGGISSYSLILMTINFLQMHPRVNPLLANENLGILLIEFFELYGKYFNYVRTAIRVKDGGSYLTKDEIKKQFTNRNESILCIEDPFNETNDIGKSSYDALKIKEAFKYAYFTLSHIVLPQNSYLLENNPSILGRILRITKPLIDYRLKVKKLYCLNNPLVSAEADSQLDFQCGSSTNDKVDFYIGERNLYQFRNNDMNNNVNNNKNLLSLFSYFLNFLYLYLLFFYPEKVEF